MRSRPTVRLLASLLVLGVAVGCSDDDAADDDGAEATTTTSSSAAGPPTSTTRVAVARSVVVSEHGELGGWADGRWVRAGAGAAASAFVPGHEYTLVPLQGGLTPATAVGPGEEVEFCNGIPQVVLNPAFPQRTGFRELVPIAVQGVPEPAPRRATVLDPDAAVYREAAAAVLADLGIDDLDPDVVQVVRADLSGDGTDEVLVVAEKVANPEARLGEPGDYSVLFLRQVVDEEVRTTVVAEHRVETDESGPYLLTHLVGSLADLNGDGALEVVVETHYYEGAGTQVYELSAGGRLEEVLSGGCGV